jgi:hypothetical protein
LWQDALALHCTRPDVAAAIAAALSAAVDNEGHDDAMMPDAEADFALHRHCLLALNKLKLDMFWPDRLELDTGVLLARHRRCYTCS